MVADKIIPTDKNSYRQNTFLKKIHNLHSGQNIRISPHYCFTLSSVTVLFWFYARNPEPLITSNQWPLIGGQDQARVCYGRLALEVWFMNEFFNKTST